MTNSATNNKRIAKNTILLYFRMLFMMVVSLYTSRVILSILGVEDFGIYNVVGGIVSLFSFLNGSMSTATQRYLTFEIGTGDTEKLKKTFSLMPNGSSVPVLQLLKHVTPTNFSMQKRWRSLTVP